jgi:predicted house-cleaning noncanonical NTP pyrophosphatase (MazG superfamily)
MVPKLVRDHIPRAIAATASEADHVAIEVTTAREADRVGWLLLKLQEEVDEFKKDANPEELVDIYEVIRTLWDLCNPAADLRIAEAAAAKRVKLGGFARFTILTDVRREGER